MKNNHCSESENKHIAIKCLEFDNDIFVLNKYNNFQLFERKNKVKSFNYNALFSNHPFSIWGHSRSDRF